MQAGAVGVAGVEGTPIVLRLLLGRGRTRGRVLGLELLPLLVTGDALGLEGGQLGLLGRAQDGVDLGADGSALLHASGGGGAFGLGQGGRLLPTGAAA